MIKEMICTVCPMGCRLKVEQDGENIQVTGNTCPRGKKYGVSELTNPVRTLTTTVKIKSKVCAVLPVRTDNPIKKGNIFPAMKIISEIEVSAPVHIGDIIVKDFIEKGINLISTKTVEE